MAGRVFVAIQLGCDGKLQLRLGSLQALIGITFNPQKNNYLSSAEKKIEKK